MGKMWWWRGGGKECVGSDNGTADVTLCPLHYWKEANTYQNLLEIRNAKKLIPIKVNMKHIYIKMSVKYALLFNTEE